jgi:cytochrome P450
MSTSQSHVREIESFLGSKEYFTNPYPLYHRLRSEFPVYWSEKLKCWLLTRYDDCLSALRDYRRLSNRDRMTVMMKPFGGEAGKRFQVVRKHFMQGVIFSDPPDHTRLRTLINKAFTPSTTEKKRPRIQEIVEGLIDPLRDKGRKDLIRDFAFPLPNTIRSEILGLPLEDTDQLKGWADDVVALFGAGADEARMERGQRSLSSIREYLSQLISKRRHNPGEDLISTLILAREQNDQLSDDELLSTCSTLFTASQETTTSLIGSGMLALLRNPDQLQKLKANPDQITTAVEEILRYDGPLQRQLRAATEDFEMRGVHITQGQMVCPVLGAANRDPEVFAAPDVLDIARADNPHIAFGFGIHWCVGAPLARLEVQIAINTLLRRIPTLELASDDIDRPEDYTVRSIKSLPVEFGG